MSQKSIGNTKLIELAFIDERKRVRLFEKECPSIPHIMVYDIRLSCHEEQENYIYAQSPDLQYNLRQGHTIAEVYDPEDFNNK